MGIHKRLQERIEAFREKGQVEMAKREARKKNRIKARKVGAARNPDDYPGTWNVYFIQVGEDGPIKIGRAKGSPLTRLDALQVGIPFDLRLVAIIPHVSHHLELDLHRRFDHLRIRGEWFKPEPELLDYIRENALAWTLRRDQVPAWWFGPWDVRDRFRDDPMGRFEDYEAFQEWYERVKEN
jgi:hypothetical protein